jgi:hypothetical protein
LTNDNRQKLIELLQEAQSLADRLGEGIALYMIRNALMELERGTSAMPPA